MQKSRCGWSYVSVVVLYFAAMVLHGADAKAQVYDKIVIHAGDSISKHNSYLFRSFKNATVKFRDGRSFVYQMDFNTLMCAMQYLKNGDTLTITNPDDVDSILMDSSSFFYDHQKGYFQIVAGADAGSLAVYRRTTFEPVSTGGMGEGRQSGGVEMISVINTRLGTAPLVLSQDIYAIEKTSYFVIDKKGEIEDAGKSAFLKIYGGDKKTFDQYVKANKIDYRELDKLEKLFHFCTQSKM